MNVLTARAIVPDYSGVINIGRIRHPPAGDYLPATKKYVDDTTAAFYGAFEAPLRYDEVDEKVKVDAASAIAAGIVSTDVQTFAGAKTFTDAIFVPAPTEDTHAATKKYVDDSLVEATPLQAGVVSTGAQSFGGLKTFEDGLATGAP